MIFCKNPITTFGRVYCLVQGGVFKYFVTVYFLTFFVSKLFGNFTFAFHIIVFSLTAILQPFFTLQYLCNINFYLKTKIKKNEKKEWLLSYAILSPEY